MTHELPAIVAGPFSTHLGARRAEWRASFEPIPESPGWLRWVGSTIVARRYGDRWYVLRRSESTVHAGNKAWRKRVKQRRNEGG